MSVYVRRSLSAKPTRRQRIYYLYLVIANAVALLERSSRASISAEIDCRYRDRVGLGLRFTGMSDREMFGEISGLVARAVWADE